MIPIFCRPEKRKADLVFICLNEIKDKQLSDICFGIVYELKDAVHLSSHY